MPQKSTLSINSLPSQNTFYDFIVNGPGCNDPSAIVAIDGVSGRACNYGELFHNLDRVAVALQSIGLRKQNVVAMFLSNSLEYITTVLGTLKAGMIFTGFNPTFTAEELAYHIDDSCCKILFVNKTTFDVAWQALKLSSNKCKVVCIDDDSNVGNWPKEVLRYKDLLHVGGEFIPHDVGGEDICCLLYSSGTTGRPKGVMNRNRGITLGCSITFQQSYCLSTGKNDHVICILPMYHIYGFAVVGHCINVGSVLVTIPKYEPELYLRLIQRYKVPLLYCVPPMVVFLAKHPLVEKYDVSSVEGIIVGAAPSGKDICEELIARLNLKYFAQVYGMTEICSASHGSPKVKGRTSKLGSCGRLLATFECKVIDVDTGKECGANQNGEILVRSETLMAGYWHRPKETAEIMDSEGFLHTGDIGYFDEDGDYFIVDRLKELIKVKGFQVAPAELEDLLLSHPEVQDAAVIGVSDKLAGEAPKAFVVRKQHTTITEKDILSYIEKHVAPFKRLKGGVEFIDLIPKSPSGKILRRVLRLRQANQPAKL